MTSITFDQLISRIPTAARLPLVRSASQSVESPDHKDFFVAPALLSNWQPEAKSSIVLVSARGAVGKTTFAGELAWKAGAHLWPLGKFQVGHQFLEGALAKCYGDDAYSHVARELREGKRLMVLDGLDEARLHAGERNFDAFLDSIAERFREAGEKPSLVILGRPLAASYTANRLFDAGVGFEWYEIDYFDRGAAERFIENYLERGRYKPHRHHRPDFERARSTLLTWLEKSVPEGVDPKNLIGYAPVLLFLAKLLDVGNPYGQVQQLEKDARHQRPGAALVQIAEGILIRDMGKVVEETPNERLRMEYQKAGVWTPEEQCIRLLAKKVGYALKVRPPTSLPDRLRSQYEEAIEGWVGDHPFNDQPLFEDYVLAWLLSGGTVEKELSAAVREHLKGERAEYRPTPLLLWFVGNAGAEDGTEERVTIDAADFGFVYESALADAMSAGRGGRGLPEANFPKLALSSTSAAGSSLIGEIRFPGPVGTDEKTGGRKVRLDLKDTGDALWFWRSLLCANIAVGGAVRIGTGTADFLLGPDVDLECDSFACDAGNVRVTAANENENVMLSAKRYLGDSVPQLSGWGDGTLHLHVRWQPLHFPWNRYPLLESKDPLITEATWEAFLKLRRLLMLFQAKGFGDLARTADLIENPVFAGTGLARRMLDYCLERRLIRKGGGFYYLSRREIDDREINWEDVRAHRISSPVASLINDFLAWPGR